MEPLIDDILPLVQELDRVERQLEILAFEKQKLRELLAERLQNTSGPCLWLPTDAGRIQLQLVTQTTFTYNEPLLRQRLGERFARILVPDPRKLRLQEEASLALLEPILDQIGKVARHRVQAGFEQGLFRASEFAGAFNREAKQMLRIRKQELELPEASEQPY